MPQLVKGGKYAYGWSQVDARGNIIVPAEAMAEYRFIAGNKAILINGSRRSGGFGLAHPEILQRFPFSTYISHIPELISFQIPEGSIIKSGGRSFCWVNICDGGVIKIPVASLYEYDIEPLNMLLAVSGSNRALGYIVRGPIIEEANKHPELLIFKFETKE